MGAGFCFCS
jgi:hypothetical protein